MSPVVLEPPSLNIHMARMQQFNPNIASEHALNPNGESRTSVYLFLHPLDNQPVLTGAHR